VKGSPWLRAKRARTASRLVMGKPFVSGLAITRLVAGPAWRAAATSRHRVFFAGGSHRSGPPVRGKGRRRKAGGVTGKVRNWWERPAETRKGLSERQAEQYLC
jgi:hypothetical protein